METPVKDRLKKKSKKKASASGNAVPEQEPDIFAMMNQVSKMLKENPEVINKVNKMVSSLMGNQDLLNSLSEKMGNLPDLGQDQTLPSNSDTDI